jgi:hypothetical protein
VQRADLRVRARAIHLPKKGLSTMSKPRVPGAKMAVVSLLLGCSSEPTWEPVEVTDTAEQALLGPSSFDCNGGPCLPALETNFERAMKLGRTAARSAAFLQCVELTAREGVGNDQVLADDTDPLSGCGFETYYPYDGWGPYQSCTPYSNTEYGGHPVQGLIEHDAAWDERVDRQLARIFTAAQVNLDLHHSIAPTGTGAVQAGSEPDGTLHINWGLITPNDGLNVKIGPARNSSGVLGTLWHEAAHDLGYDHGCRRSVVSGSTDHGNCGRTSNWNPSRSMNNIAAFCIKEVLLRSSDPVNAGCGVTGVVGSAEETLRTCANGGRMTISNFVKYAGPEPTAVTGSVSCHCVPDIPGQANRDGDEFGYASAAGDFDCDGFADLAIGAPGESINGFLDVGAVYLYRGSSQGLRPMLRLTPTTVGISVIPGARFGQALATGRFNRDCANELVIGAPGWNADKGAAAVVPGSPVDGLLFDEARLLSTVDVGGFAEAFGVGDYTRDGVLDLAVGAPQFVRSGLRTGRVRIYRGTDAAAPSSVALESSTTLDPPSPANGLRFGASLGFGNVMGVSPTELVVGAPGRSGKGSIIIVRTDNHTMTEFAVQTAGNFGERLVVGDFLGNDYADIAASSPTTGQTYTLTGGNNGVGNPVGFTNCPECQSGGALAIFPLPGKDDLLVGRPGSDRVVQYHWEGNDFSIKRNFNEDLWSAKHDPGDGRVGNCPVLDNIDSHKRCLIDEVDFSSDIAAFGTSISVAKFGQGHQVAIGAPSDTVGFGTPIRSGSLYVRAGDAPVAQEYRIDQVTMTYGGSPIDLSFQDQVRGHELFCVHSQTCDVADMNDDGRADLIAFVKGDLGQEGDVYVSIAQASGTFGPAERRHHDFCPNFGQECTVADVNGDGRGDLVAFIKDTVPADSGDVRVALARSDGTFAPSSDWLDDDVCRGNEVCVFGRINSDEAEDLVVFKRGTDPNIRSFGDVLVALANPGTGKFVFESTLRHDLFCIGNERCTVGDVDGDGDDDLIAFVTSGPSQGLVWVGETTPTPVNFGTAVWHRSFCSDPQQCDVGDVDGDGKVDLVRFNTTSSFQAQFALSNGNDFGPVSTAGSGFCSSGQVCRVADVNDDGRADLIRFLLGSNGDVNVAFSGSAP